jgi:hypothetical protein
LFSIKNLVNKASEYKKGQTTKEAVEKKLDELSLTDEQKREMLVLFEQFAHSQRYIEAEPGPLPRAEPEAGPSGSSTPASSFSLTRPREVEDDSSPQEHPVVRVAYKEGEHELLEAADLRRSSGLAKIEQLLRMNVEHLAFVAAGRGSLTSSSRNKRDTVLFPFMHCYTTHFQSNAESFLAAFGQKWPHSKFAEKCKKQCSPIVVEGEGVGGGGGLDGGEE